MNKFILIAMDRDNKTEKRLMDTVVAACKFYAAVVETTGTFPHDHAVAAAVAGHAYADSYNLDSLINEYFDITGEDKQTYINAIKESK